MGYLQLTAFLCVLVCVSGFGQPKWVVGPYSTLEDDSPSKVDCPPGHFVRECSCADERTCDGAELKNGSCIARQKYDVKLYTRAIAQCFPEDGYDVKILREGKVMGDYLRCPHGYNLESCSKFDPWSTDRLTHFLRSWNGCGFTRTMRTDGFIGAGYNYFAYLSIVCTKSDFFD